MITRESTTDLDQLRRLAALGFRPASIYDIGASDGMWSAQASEVFPDALYDLFEPLYGTLPDYEASMREHHSGFFESPFTRIHQLAVGREPGEIEMTLFENRLASTCLPVSGSEPGARKLRVPVTTIDRCVSEEEMPTPDLIKIDTQGLELEILHGAKHSLRYCTALFLECWTVKSYEFHTPLLVDIEEFLKLHGFYAWEFGDPYRSEAGVLESVDVVFLNAAKRISPLHAWHASRHQPSFLNS